MSCGDVRRCTTRLATSAAVRELMAIEHMGGTKEVRHCRDSLCFARFRILLRHGTSQVGRSRLPTVPTCGPPLRTWRRAAPRLALRARCRGAVRQSVGEGPPAAGADVRRRAAAAVPRVASQLHTTVAMSPKGVSPFVPVVMLGMPNVSEGTSVSSRWRNAPAAFAIAKTLQLGHVSCAFSALSGPLQKYSCNRTGSASVEPALNTR